MLVYTWMWWPYSLWSSKCWRMLFTHDLCLFQSFNITTWSFQLYMSIRTVWSLANSWNVVGMYWLYIFHLSKWLISGNNLVEVFSCFPESRLLLEPLNVRFKQSWLLCLENCSSPLSLYIVDDIVHLTNNLNPTPWIGQQHIARGYP